MEYAWLAVPVDTKWEAGYKYVYTLDFTSGAGYPDPLGGDPTGSTALGGPIKFTMDVNGNVDADKFNELFVESWINYYGNVQARLFMFKMRGNNWKNDFNGVLLDD